MIIEDFRKYSWNQIHFPDHPCSDSARFSAHGPFDDEKKKKKYVKPQIIVQYEIQF